MCSEKQMQQQNEPVSKAAVMVPVVCLLKQEECSNLGELFLVSESRRYSLKEDGLRFQVTLNLFES